MSEPARLRRAVLVVALANFLYFGWELSVARRIGSVSLLADSVDFLEDTSVNLLAGWFRYNAEEQGEPRQRPAPRASFSDYSLSCLGAELWDPI